MILEAYSALLGDDLEAKLRDFLARKSYIAHQISQHAENNHLFRQASTLLIYLAAATMPNLTKDKWPFIPDDLILIYTDLGLNFEGY
ncbi:hypothetical protein AN403_5258 [Pseudomonas fluorescens]|uniref:Uncharacterized protein n=1 Tax=Pseudomonas fluorescens TaxID=294 RepID=A0A0P9BDE1_PSEFL|nr:hypothetical protein AN403_5258 [Pseudomonas fluorescens]